MKSRSQGFTLIESLIALLLLSVGLLGAAVLLLDGLKSRADALRQAAATRLVLDTADRIRANPRARSFYDTRRTTRDAACAANAACDPAQRAASDLAHFRIQALNLFPGPDTAATITFEPAIGPAAPDRYRLSLRWRGPRDSPGAHDAVAFHLLAQPVAG